MKSFAVFLNPKGSILGEISSDTLFGALCWSIRTLHGDNKLNEMLSCFNIEPKYLHSSPFPYLKNSSTKIKFFPKPKLPVPSAQVLEALSKAESKTSDIKNPNFKKAYLKVVEMFDEIKNTSFVSEQLFNNIVTGNLGIVGIFRRLKTSGYMNEDIEIIGNALVTHRERKLVDPASKLLIKAFIKEVDIQRNQIDRVTGVTAEGLLFFSPQTFFIRGENGLKSGLWFIVKTEDFNFIEPLLRYIADTGLGGDRSVGKGHFDIEWEEFGELPRAKEPNCFINLSRYIPEADEIDITKSPLSYVLKNIRGKHEAKFITQPKQPHFKEMVRIFEEGSIFPLIKEKSFYGKLEMVGGKSEVGRDVYQNGITLPVIAKIAVKYEV